MFYTTLCRIKGYQCRVHRNGQNWRSLNFGSHHSLNQVCVLLFICTCTHSIWWLKQACNLASIRQVLWCNMVIAVWPNFCPPNPSPITREIRPGQPDYCHGNRADSSIFKEQIWSDFLKMAYWIKLAKVQCKRFPNQWQCIYNYSHYNV